MCNNNAKTSDIFKMLHLDLVIKYDLNDDEIEFLLKLDSAIELSQNKNIES